MATLTPTVQKVRQALLTELEQVSAQGGKVLSLYIDLDPTEFAVAPARQTEVNSLLNEAAELVERLDQESKKSLRQDLELVRRFLTGNDDWAEEARSVAVFAASAANLFQVVKLPESLPTAVFIEDAPYVAPIREMLWDGKWCVVLMDRRTAKIYVGSPAKLRELEETEDVVHGRHSAGGWSQARYGRSVEEDVQDHLKNVADRLLALQKRMDFDHIVFGTQEELWPRIREVLHSYVEEDLVGRIDVDTQHVSVEDLEREIEKLAAQEQKERERALIEKLREGLGGASLAAAGPRDVLRALNEARVETLLVAQGFTGRAAVCSKCGFLGEEAGECPVDGERMRPAALVDAGRDRADETGAETFVVQDPESLKEFGSIATILRF